MTVKELIARLEKEPLNAKVLITSTHGDLYEVRGVAFTWATKESLSGRYHRQKAKSTENVVTAVEFVL